MVRIFNRINVFIPHVLPPTRTRNFDQIDLVAPQGDEKFMLVASEPSEVRELIESGYY